VTELDPTSRAAIALDLADRVSTQMGTTVPDAVHPETWLACVAAAVQRAGAEPVGAAQ